MLTIGDTFPSFTAKAVLADKSFTDLTDKSYDGKWKV